MAIEILDGTGKGYSLKVGPENRAFVDARTFTKEHDKSQNGDAFIFNTTDTANTLTITATGGPILFIQNDNTEKELTIEQILVSNSAIIECALYRNPVLGTIGNNNIHTPANLNFGSNRSAEATAYNWDEVGDGMTGLTGGTLVAYFIVPAGITTFNLGGAITMPGGSSFYISLKNASEATLVVRGFFEEPREG